jgi:hypothetical protein
MKAAIFDRRAALRREIRVMLGTLHGRAAQRPKLGPVWADCASANPSKHGARSARMPPVTQRG